MTPHAQCTLVLVVIRITMAVSKEENAEDKRTKLERFRVILTEDDIPGASLESRNPEILLKNEELKRWLKWIQIPLKPQFIYMICII